MKENIKLRRNEGISGCVQSMTLKNKSMQIITGARSNQMRPSKKRKAGWGVGKAALS